jgi:flagellar biogenesis protein FliO
MEQSTSFLLYVMFWTILAMMLVLIYSLKQVISTQRYIKSIDTNIEKLVRKTLMDEERILHDIEDNLMKKTPTHKKSK